MTRSEEIRAILGISRAEFARRYNIPIRTLEDWDSGKSGPPAYVVELLERAVKEDNDRKGREYNMIFYKVRSTFLGGDKPIDSYFDTKEKAQEFLDERCDNGEVIKVEVKANYELNYNHDGCSFGDLTYGDFDATEEELD